MTESSADASLRGRIAANERWARVADRTAATAPARAGLDAKFAAEVDPDGTLGPEDRARRIDAKRRAHFARLARLSAQNRRRAAAGRQAAADLRSPADEIDANDRRYLTLHRLFSCRNPGAAHGR
jgi:hypothetical protein